jgi:UDP-N-acetylmuramoyl-tripeptide--D-alanyl-D-alanine ligase
MEIHQLYAIYLANPVITTDSRTVTENSLFFALKGEHFNGNHFAMEALRRGASFAVIDEPQTENDNRLIMVDDVLTCLQNLAAYHRRQLAIPVLGITGSNGKTTTKELTASVLSQKYRVKFTLGNLNNHIGVPLTLLSFDKSTEFGVVEMGANHPGEIGQLSRIAQPDFGLITNVGKAHLEGFGSFEMVIQTKSELYRYLESREGTIFIHGENGYLITSAGRTLKRITYGTGEENRLRGEIIHSSPYLNLRIWFPKGILYINTRLIGDYNLENILAAAAIGNFFGVDPLLIKKGIEEYIPANNRSQMVRTGSNEIIMDAYNANPSSMQASILNFLSLTHLSKVLIIGDMLELGEYSREEHQKIIDLTLGAKLTSVMIVGKHFSETQYPDNYKAFSNVFQLTDYLKEHPPRNSLILIKGSRGIGLEKILDIIN